MGKKGRRYEHNVASTVTECLSGGFSWPVGYSGNGARPAPDIVTVGAGCVRGDELKKTAQDTFGVPASDLRQLSSIERAFFDVGLVVKFSNRAPVLIDSVFDMKPAFEMGVDSFSDSELAEAYKHGCDDAFNPRVTTGGSEPSLRLSRPSLSDWESAQSGYKAGEKIAAATTATSRAESIADD